MKFASKKEVRDRLKEFDAPDFADYIDPDTIDKINAAKKPPRQPKKKSEKTEEQQREDVRKENQARIQKMKELYGMFVKMQQDQGQQVDDTLEPNSGTNTQLQ